VIRYDRLAGGEVVDKLGQLMLLGEFEGLGLVESFVRRELLANLATKEAIAGLGIDAMLGVRQSGGMIACCSGKLVEMRRSRTLGLLDRDPRNTEELRKAGVRESE
jgi:hypothetical protein